MRSKRSVPPLRASLKRKESTNIDQPRCQACYRLAVRRSDEGEAYLSARDGDENGDEWKHKSLGCSIPRTIAFSSTLSRRPRRFLVSASISHSRTLQPDGMDSGIEVALISASISAVAKADFYVFLIIAFVYAVWLVSTLLRASSPAICASVEGFNNSASRCG